MSSPISPISAPLSPVLSYKSNHRPLSLVSLKSLSEASLSTPITCDWRGIRQHPLSWSQPSLVLQGLSLIFINGLRYSTSPHLINHLHLDTSSLVHIVTWTHTPWHFFLTKAIPFHMGERTQEWTALQTGVLLLEIVGKPSSESIRRRRGHIKLPSMSRCPSCFQLSSFPAPGLL
ncbi:hypothetical protein TNCV_1355131 [Trichonephila clavipes]|uniref:Uncharacterized protein n=1 Tax=Trichonephila clavipes TaxID=2585209 RepID=A0A8X6SF55_TRICX|nr:hypothetical protein TNCV_1355131 [Trichonephila clavipes]